jgi:Patatin-like phospholipase
MHFSSFRSSRGSSDLLQNTKIWEAARATCAAPSFFDSIKIGKFGEEFIDGGIGANNPVRALWIEVKHSLLSLGESLEKNLKCLFSTGTGVPSLKPFGDNLLEITKTLKSIATETEATAKLFHRNHSELDEGNRYFCFSLTMGLEKIGLDKAAQKNVIMAATKSYLESQTVKRQMPLCGKNVGDKKCGSMYPNSAQ